MKPASGVVNVIITMNLFKKYVTLQSNLPKVIKMDRIESYNEYHDRLPSIGLDGIITEYPCWVVVIRDGIKTKIGYTQDAMREKLNIKNRVTV